LLVTLLHRRAGPMAILQHLWISSHSTQLLRSLNIIAACLSSAIKSKSTTEEKTKVQNLFHIDCTIFLSYRRLHAHTKCTPLQKSTVLERGSRFFDGPWGLAKTPACTSAHCGLENACSVQDASNDTVNSTCFRFQAWGQRRAERPDEN
jgi:hypothetical protein